MKRVWCGVLTFLLLVGMTACDGGGDTPTTSTTVPTTVTTTTTATANDKFPVAGSVEVTFEDDRVLLGDAAIVPQGDVQMVFSALQQGGSTMQDEYGTIHNAQFPNAWMTEYVYGKSGINRTAYIETVVPVGEDTARLVRYLTYESKYGFNGVFVGSLFSKVTEKWQAASGERRLNTQFSDIYEGVVYPLSENYEIVFYRSESGEGRVCAIGIEAIVPSEGDGEVVPRRTQELAVEMTDGGFTIGELMMERYGEAAPLLALLGSPETVERSCNSDYYGEWYAKYTYADCSVETVILEGETLERFSLLTLLDKRHSIDGVTVGMRASQLPDTWLHEHQHDIRFQGPNMHGYYFNRFTAGGGVRYSAVFELQDGDIGVDDGTPFDLERRIAALQVASYGVIDEY